MPQAVKKHGISVGRLLRRSSRRTEGMRKKQDERIKAENFPELKRYESSDSECILHAEQSK